MDSWRYLTEMISLDSFWLGIVRVEYFLEINSKKLLKK